eukprot:7246417-Pyramimonas_sp.AAC.1
MHTPLGHMNIVVICAPRATKCSTPDTTHTFPVPHSTGTRETVSDLRSQAPSIKSNDLGLEAPAICTDTSE